MDLSKNRRRRLIALGLASILLYILVIFYFGLLRV